MVIRVFDIVSSADTTEQGQAVLVRLLDELDHHQEITISFEGIHAATSSFVNVAFVPLLRHISFDDIKTRIRIVESTRQINGMIRARLERNASPCMAA